MPRSRRSGDREPAAEPIDIGRYFRGRHIRLTAQLKAQMQDSAKLDQAISAILEEVACGG